MLVKTRKCSAWRSWRRGRRRQRPNRAMLCSVFQRWRPRSLRSLDALSGPAVGDAALEWPSPQVGVVVSLGPVQLAAGAGLVPHQRTSALYDVTRRSDPGPRGAVSPGTRSTKTVGRRHSPCRSGARSRSSPSPASHKEQGSMIRRCIIWRNKHTADIRLHAIVTRVNVA